MTTKESSYMFVPNLEKSPQFEVPLVKYIFCVEKKKSPSLAEQEVAPARVEWFYF